MIDFTNYFDKIYCINLDSSTERWDNCEKEFEKWGISGVERYTGIDGDTLDTKDQLLLPGEIGLIETHINIIKEAKEKKINNILIFEDDVYFNEEILDLNLYIESLPEDWVLFYLGAMQVGGSPPIPIGNNILKVNNALRAHSLVINSKIFDLILDLLPKLNKQVDVHYMDLQKILPTYCTNPYIAYQRNGFSDIQKKLVNRYKYSS